MKAHVVGIGVLESFCMGSNGAAELKSRQFKWECSCGESGKWRDKALSARRGGEQHRAKREK